MPGSLAFLVVGLSLLGTLAAGSRIAVRPLLLLAAALAGAMALLADAFFGEAASYGLLRRPAFAAAGAWLALAMLCIGRDLSLGAIAGFGSRALVAFALVGAAAVATYGIAGVDPFAVEPQSLPSAYGMLGLLLLGACLAVGTTSFAAIGPPRAAFDFAAALVAATSIAGPLFPGYSLLPEGLFGEVALAAAAVAGAVTVVGALGLRGPAASLTLVPAVALAIVAPAGLALITEDVSSWFTA